MRILRNFYYHFLKNVIEPSKNPSTHAERTIKQELTGDLQEQIKIIKQVLGDSDDIVIRQFKIGIGQVAAFVLYIDGLTDKSFVAENILNPLTVSNPMAEEYLPKGQALKKLVMESIITAGEVKEVTDFKDVFTGILAGEAALFITGVNKALLVSCSGFETRGVQEPATEAAVRGPREGFTENLRTNTSLIRRKIKNPNLRFEAMTIGRQTKTQVCLTYVKGISNEKVIAEVRARLARVDTDAILETGYIEAYIEDAPFSPFATTGYTERPDVVAGKMLEGRMAILVDGTPMVLTIPHLFIEGFQTNEDYYYRPHYVTLIRWFRFLAFFLTVFLPSIYIALTTFHQEMIPTPLLITMAAAKEGTPFPAIVEAVGMGITFELLREAGIRMPRPVGQAVSIVGALVIGDAAVSAGLVGAPMVIVTALTAITSFVVPTRAEVALLLRLSLTIFAAVAGFYGVFVGSLLVIIHLVSLRSFGAPYLAPLAPLTWSDLKDVFVRVPLWAMKTRPRTIEYANRRRQGDSLKPQPSPRTKK